MGRGRSSLFDLRPAERSPGHSDIPGAVWTYFFAKEDSYDRVDYILISSGMKPEWKGIETYVLSAPGWITASDHRPIVAGFLAEEMK